MNESRRSPSRRRATRRNLVLLIGGTLLAGTALTIFGEERSSPPTVQSKSAGRNDDVLLLLSHSLRAERQAPASLTVNVTSPQNLTLERTLAASGSISARDELIVGSDANGVRLTDVRVDVGSVVRRGQLLARGDDAQLRAQLAQQDAAIRQARAELAQAEANLERAERIRDSGVYSVEALQTRRTSAEAASAKLELALAQRRELEVRIAQTRVLAPADGVIARRNATVGVVLQPGLELFRLIRDEQLEWRAELPAHAIARVQADAPVRVALDDGGHVVASVRLVEPTIDPKSRNGVVRVSLPRGTALKAGGHATGEIAIANAAMLTVPESVVLNRDGQPFVYVIGADDVARLTRIQTGARQRGLVEVTSGLQPGMRVVSTGAGFVKDGERVRVAADKAVPLQQAAHVQGVRS
jgi:HlyD family secretion protein